MSSQFRRDRSRFHPQQTWVPRGASASIAVVNELTERSSESLHAGAAASRPVYLQRQHNGPGQHQRNNVVGSPPPNRQRVASRTRPVNQGKKGS
ncbi:hypothetical protein Bca4012_008791 [Brassica carinata]